MLRYDRPLRLRAPTLILAALLALAGCDGGGDEADVPLDALGSDTSAAAASRMLSPPGGAIDLGEPVLIAAFQRMEADTADEASGTIRIYPYPGTADTTVADTAAGGFRLEVVMDGIVPGGHAWHIHDGACDGPAPIVVPFTKTETSEGIAQPLSGDATGAARALVEIPGSRLPLAALQSGDYSVRVHLNPGEDPGPVIACADLG